MDKEVREKVVKLALQNIRVVGWAIIGCSECPFSSEHLDKFGKGNINTADPDEGDYDCALLEKQKIWGENPICDDKDWIRYIEANYELKGIKRSQK